MKCVMVINRDLPLGLIANTAAVLAMSIGKVYEELIGEDVVDADGIVHPGITSMPIAILNGDTTAISEIRQKVLSNQNQELFFVDFCDAAQQSKIYDEYKQRLSSTPTIQLNYLGIAICGSNKQVEKLTGNIGLLK